MLGVQQLVVGFSERVSHNRRENKLLLLTSAVRNC